MSVSITEQETLVNIYKAFNSRDIDSVLSVMHDDVDWPNGWEGGRVHGHKEVRDYWTRQWKEIDPYVEPTSFSIEDDGRVVVNVHQLVRDLSGNVLFDGMVQHVYLVQDGLIKSMEIRK